MTTTTILNGPLDKIIIVGEGFDELGQRYLKLKVKGSGRDLPPFAMADILEPKRLYRELGDAGCKLFSRSLQNQLQGMLQDYEQVGEPSFSVVTRLGAFGRFYVRPNEIVGTPPLPIEIALGSLNSYMLDKYRCRGTLKDWQEKLGVLCNGNTRLMFVASLACTGPILSFVAGPRTGGFQLSGRAETGKTAGGSMIAGSIWGCHRDAVRKDKGFAESWNTTNNRLEDTARAHSDAVLVADETNLAGANPRERAINVLDGAFRLSEGTKKGRYNEAEVAAWRFYFLFTSNLTVDELAEQGGIPIDDQHRGRVVDVVLPLGPGAHGVYEDLHGFADGAALTDAIKTRCRTVFGTPGYELVRRIYKNKKTRLAAKVFVAARRKYYIKRARAMAVVQGVKPLQRATARFATVYAAGCLAIKYGIFTWRRKDLLQAVLSCQFDSLAIACKSSTGPDLRSRLIDHLTVHRHSFLNLNKGKPSQADHKLGSASGYVHTHRGVDWIYLTPDQLKAVIGVGPPAKRLKAALVAEGKLAASDKKTIVQRPLFQGKGNHGYRWVHAFRASLLAN